MYFGSDAAFIIYQATTRWGRLGNAEHGHKLGNADGNISYWEV